MAEYLSCSTPVMGNSGFFRATPSELKGFYEIKGGFSELYMNEGYENNL
jgi:hypothetical protein